MTEFFAFFLMTWVVFRTARFIALDSLIEGTRDKVLNRLTTGDDGNGNVRPLFKGRDAAFHDLPLWRRKITELLGCPWCMCVWISAPATAILDYYYSVPLPFVYWWALSGASVIWWHILDSE